MLFSEQFLQKSIDQNFKNKILTPKQIETQVDNLNEEFELSLSVEWEIVLLNSISKLGNVGFEKKFGSKFPDIFFSSNLIDLEFIADITTVSDYGLQEDNPTVLFEIRLKEFVNKFDLSIDNFTCKINSNAKGFRGNSKTKLKLPAKVNFYTEFFNNAFKQFLSSIKENKNQSKSYEVKTENIEVVIEYNPAQHGFVLSMDAYDVYPPVNQNPFHNALKKKAAKLKKTEYNGIKGIFLCDGGSSMFLFRKNSALHYGSEQTIREFLRQNRSINFVSLIIVDRDTFQLKTETYVSRTFIESLNKIKVFFGELRKVLPKAQTSAHSAMHFLSELKIMGEKYSKKSPIFLMPRD